MKYKNKLAKKIFEFIDTYGDKENKEKTEFKEILKTVRKKIVDTYLS